MGNARKTILVVGLGRFGIALCSTLSELKQRVIAVDKNPDKVKEIAETVDISAQLNATEEEALDKIGAREVDVAVVTIGENIEASIIASTILQGYGVPQIISRAQNHLHARILAKVGVHRVIFPEKEMGERVGEQIVHPWLNRFARFTNIGSLVGEIEPLPEMTGKSLIEQQFRKTYEVIILLVKKNGQYMLPGPDTVIDREDTLLVAGPKERVERIIHIQQKNAKES